MTADSDKQAGPPGSPGEGEFEGWSKDRLIKELHMLQRHLNRGLRETAGTDAGAEGELRSVRVPEAFAKPFLHAQQYVGRYFATLVHEPETASISIAGERYILLRAASMSVEFVELVTSLYQDRGPLEARGVANNLLFDLAHALGKADALSFQQKMKVDDPIDALSAGPVHFAFAGWAFVDIHSESSPTPDEDFFLYYDHPYSFESHSWLAKGRRSDEPVCVMNAGYSSGWCEESFGLPLVAAEIECVACGHEHCRFIMAPPSRIEEHLGRFGYRGRHRESGKGRSSQSVAVPEFFQRRRLEDELLQANTRLEERVAERTAELSETAAQLRLLAKAVDNAVEGIVTMTSDEDARLVLRTVNRGFVRVSGIPEQEALGKSLEILNVVAVDQPRLERLREHVRQRRSFELEVNACRPDGTEYTLELHIMPGADKAGEESHWIGLFRDVTRRRRHLAELRRQATYDALTDLPNRVLLLDRLEEEVQHVRESGETLALMVLDLDRFKEINDTFGHHAGDALLEQVGPRLRRRTRSSDLVSRLGGDEFAVLLPGIQSEGNALRQARGILEALHDPFVVEQQEVAVGASIGLVLCPRDGDSAATLLRRADVAMYVAKHAHTGVEIYRSEDDTHSPERLALAGELRSGIEREELLIHYQPQICLASGRPCRLEALVRWQHPQKGLLSPGEFVPFIELSNLVEQLTDWLLDRALAECGAWIQSGQDVGLSVNIAPRSVRDVGFADRVASLLERHGFPPQRLTLEITESGLLIDPQLSLPVFERLRALGVRLSIDDFGTGYSSFAHLRTLPVDELKIDRSFVFDMVEDVQDAAIVQSTIQLGKSIGREIVAEGVETSETFERLQALGCDLVQGFFIARPMPREQVLGWLQAQQTA